MENTSAILTAEVSLYPLRTDDVSGGVRDFVAILKDVPGLALKQGNMSTQLIGNSDIVFGSLKQAYTAVAQNYDCVMTVKVSNACPT